MRIIFFNIWHGKVWNELKKFILDESAKTDIFCFLEVDPSLQRKLGKILPGFTPIFNRGIKTVYLNGVIEGRSIFVKKGIEIRESSPVDLFKPVKTDAGGLFWAKLSINGKELLIAEAHGKARPGDKKDTAIRINQSKKIIDLFKNKNTPTIIGGDFNLMPDTESIAMFEKAGYKNLIKEFGIKNTRNKLNWNRFEVSQYFADFVFTSPGIKIKSFQVPYNEVSDHLPQILEFDLPDGKVDI